MKMAKLLVVFVLTYFAGLSSCWRLIHNGRLKGGFLGAPRSSYNGKLPEDRWFTQRLDHFNEAETRTWKQRYFVNDTFHKPGGPVFLMIGGEGEASAMWLVEGAWIEYAKQYNALCLQLEHRFYGKSHPTEDMSTENLRFLSSEQALSDLANFRNAMVSELKLQGSKWIAFGGSYPGSLAAWFRLKYPHLVDGSIATSAPIFAQLNFKEYLGVVRDSLATTGDSCVKNIQAATEQLEKMLSTSKGQKQVKEHFQLCDDIDMTNKKDIANLFSTLTGNFENVVQYNKDNRAFEGAVGTNITIDTLCGLMTDTKIGSELERYAWVNMLIVKTYSMKCVDFSYKNMIKELQAVDWSSSASEGGRQWTYQTCTEFGYYQSSDLVDQPFGHMFNLKFSTDQCSDIFGPKFSQAFIQQGVNNTNTNYGGYGLKLTKVVFPNGSIDPWHALGITKDISPDATAIYIKGTAHCANMYPASDDDLPQLTEARKNIAKLIGQWLE